MKDRFKKELKDLLYDIQFNKSKNIVTKEERDKFKKAYWFAYRGHQELSLKPFRKSGAPSIVHPINVVKMLIELGISNIDVLIAALLHDIVEDTEYTLIDVEDEFGLKVCQIVSPLTNLKKDIDNRSVKYFHKIIVDTYKNKTVAILLIKLCDRYDNLLDMEILPTKTRKFNESQFYLPMFSQLGLFEQRFTAEDKIFANLNFKTYNKIKEAKKNSVIPSVQLNLINLIDGRLKDEFEKINTNLTSKHIFSIFRNLYSHRLTLDDINKICYIYLINIKDSNEAEKVLAFLNRIIKYKTEVKNYFESPRENGYVGIHIRVIFDENQRLEIRIRAEEHILFKKIVKAINDQNESEFVERLKIFISGNALHNEMDFINNFIKVMVEGGSYDTLVLMDNTSYFK